MNLNLSASGGHLRPRGQQRPLDYNSLIFFRDASNNKNKRLTLLESNSIASNRFNKIPAIKKIHDYIPIQAHSRHIYTTQRPIENTSLGKCCPLFQPPRASAQPEAKLAYNTYTQFSYTYIVPRSGMFGGGSTGALLLASSAEKVRWPRRK